MNGFWTFANNNPLALVFCVGILGYSVYRSVHAIASRGAPHPDDYDDYDCEE
jgi:hypothetical protein